MFKNYKPDTESRARSDVHKVTTRILSACDSSKHVITERDKFFLKDIRQNIYTLAAYDMRDIRVDFKAKAKPKIGDIIHFINKDTIHHIVS